MFLMTFLLFKYSKILLGTIRFRKKYFTLQFYKLISFILWNSHTLLKQEFEFKTIFHILVEFIFSLWMNVFFIALWIDDQCKRKSIASYKVYIFYPSWKAWYRKKLLLPITSLSFLNVKTNLWLYCIFSGGEGENKLFPPFTFFNLIIFEYYLKVSISQLVQPVYQKDIFFYFPNMSWVEW